LATKLAYQIEAIERELPDHRQRRWRRAAKHGSAWQSGSGPVSMLSCTTRLVGMTGGLYGHAPVWTKI